MGTFLLSIINIPWGLALLDPMYSTPDPPAFQTAISLQWNARGHWPPQGQTARRRDSLLTPSDYIRELSGPVDPPHAPPHPTPACFPDTSEGRAYSWRPICGRMPSWMPGLMQGGGARFLRAPASSFPGTWKQLQRKSLLLPETTPATP